MLNKNEIISILLVSIVLALSLSFFKSISAYFIALLSIVIIIALNIIPKKFLANYLDTDIEIKLWESKFQKFGARERKYTNPFPTGIALPLLFSIITLGYLKFLASLVFELKPKVHGAAKRHGLYRYTEMTEYQVGLIAAIGILSNLIFAVVGYFIGFPLFAKFSIFYATWNMIPFANLDGNKIFFGNLVMWSFLAAITLIGLVYAFVLV
jgi:hypothetical protein